MHNFIGIYGIFENMDRPQPTCAKADKVSRRVLRRAKEIYIYIVLLCLPRCNKPHRSRFWEPIDPLSIPGDSILQNLGKMPWWSEVAAKLERKCEGGSLMQYLRWIWICPTLYRWIWTSTIKKSNHNQLMRRNWGQCQYSYHVHTPYHIIFISYSFITY